MFIVRRRRRLEQIEKTEAKRILVPSSVRNPSVSALRSHTVVGGSCRSSETVADGGEGGKEREKRRERVTERKDDKGQRKRDEWAKGMLGGEKGGRGGCAASTTRSAQFTNRYSPLFVFTAAGRESTRPLPPSLPCYLPRSNSVAAPRWF